MYLWFRFVFFTIATTKIFFVGLTSMLFSVLYLVCSHQMPMSKCKFANWQNTIHELTSFLHSHMRSILIIRQAARSLVSMKLEVPVIVVHWIVHLHRLQSWLWYFWKASPFGVRQPCKEREDISNQFYFYKNNWSLIKNSNWKNFCLIEFAFNRHASFWNLWHQRK